MAERERIFHDGRDRPGPGCRVVGVENSWARHLSGLIVSRTPSCAHLVDVRWDQAPGFIDSQVNIMFLEDEPVLDQLARINDEH